jgi:integrase/recombinase XerD
VIKQKNEIAVYKPQNKSMMLQETAWSSLSLESQQAYKYDFELFFKIVKKELVNVTANDILSFIEYLRNNNYKNSSINRKIASLSKMFKVLAVSGKIKENPVEILKQFKKIKMPVEKEIKLSITMKDVKKAIKITSRTSESDKKMILIIRGLLKAGLRISEVLHIENKDIKDYDPTNKTVRIVGKGRKERFIFMENDFLSEIKNIFPKTHKTDYLFYTENFDCYDRKKIGKQMVVFFLKMIQKHVHPHMLRHLFATHKINVEKQDIKAVSKFLGHSDVSITLNSYVDTALDAKTSRIKI